MREQNALLFLLCKLNLLFYIATQVLLPHTFINRLAMISLCGTVALILLLRRKISFHWYFSFTLLIVIQSFVMSATGLSIDTERSLGMTLTLLLNLLVTLAIYNYLLISRNLERYLFFLSQLGLVLTLLLVFLSLGSLTSTRLGGGVTLSVFGTVVKYNANEVAVVAGFSFLIFLYKYYKARRKTDLLWAFWLIISIIITGSRKGIIILFIGSVILVVLADKKKRLKNTITIILVIAGLYWLLISVPILYEIIGYRLNAMVQEMLFRNSFEEASLDTRLLFIERGWNYFLERPLIGYGFDNFRFLKGSYGTYSHNNFIELLVSGGITTFVLYYLPRLAILARLLKRKEDGFINKLLFVMLLLLIILDYGYVSYYSRFQLLVFVLILAGCSCSSEELSQVKGKAFAELS